MTGNQDTWSAPSHLVRGASYDETGGLKDGWEDSGVDDDLSLELRELGGTSEPVEQRNGGYKSVVVTDREDLQSVNSDISFEVEDKFREHDEDDLANPTAPRNSLFRKCGPIVFTVVVALLVLVLKPSFGDGTELQPVPKLEEDDFDDDVRRYYKEIMSSPLKNARVGTNEVVFGPFKIDRPGLIEAFTPLVDERYVHHMLIYKSMVAVADEPIQGPFWSIVGHKQNPDAMVIFAWAHAGDNSLGQFKVTPGSGFYIGPGTDAPYIYLNVHFEVPEDILNSHEAIKAGIRMRVKDVTAKTVSAWSSCEIDQTSCPKEQGLAVSLMHNSNFELMPRQKDIDVTAHCEVQQDGIVYAYRNHGHQQGRMWVTELFRDSIYAGTVINRTVQDPQIFHRLPDYGLALRKGDILKLHCHYDTSEATWITKPGPSLTKHQEMCNQYLMYYPHFPNKNKGPGICSYKGDFENFVPSRYNEDPFESLTEDLPDVESLGEVSGTAVSPDGRTVYLLARRTNSFESTTPIVSDTIFVLQRTTGHISRYFGANLFITPHGIACDGLGSIWVTDTSLDQVFKLDARTGEVLMVLGTPGEANSNSSLFAAPTDVAVDEDRKEVYVADGYGHSRVAVFDYDTGEFIRELGNGTGSGIGEFRIVHSVAFDPSRDWVYVADRDNCRVQVFTRTGEFVKVWNSTGLCSPGATEKEAYLGHVSAVAYSQRLDVVFTLESDSVIIRQPQTNEIIDQVTSVTNGRKLNWPHDIDVGLNAVRPSIYVAELVGHRVTRLSIL